ncbi:MAG: hypothetical protein U1E33_06300 [Rhodospirillales bacterium]
MEARARALPAFRRQHRPAARSREAAVDIDRDAVARLGVTIEDVRSTSIAPRLAPGLDYLHPVERLVR